MGKEINEKKLKVLNIQTKQMLSNENSNCSWIRNYCQIIESLQMEYHGISWFHSSKNCLGMINK